MVVVWVQWHHGIADITFDEFEQRILEPHNKNIIFLDLFRDDIVMLLDETKDNFKVWVKINNDLH